MALQLTDKTFGLWTVIGRSDYKGSGAIPLAHWDCKCQCGTTRPIRTGQLTSGKTQSCGCSRSQPNPLSYGPFISRAQAKEQGLKHFFNGKPCKYGHVSEKFCSTQTCVKCHQLRWIAKKMQSKKIRKKINAAKNTPEIIKARKEKIKTYQAAYRASGKGQAVIQKRLDQPGYYQKVRETMKKNPQTMAARSIRALIKAQILAHGGRKSTKTEDLLGCSIESARRHIESLFQPGMTWENHGRYGWHIDHIRPCASFDLTDPEQQKLASHFSNLQPLWAADNLRKSDTWEPMAA